MIYATAQEWRAAPRKKICLFGMSGLGKTHLSNMLRHDGGWYHYSIDYRIGTRYMGEAIIDNAKRMALQVPGLRDLLLSDSLYIGSNIRFDNLAPLSAYLGQVGDPAKGGLPYDVYARRQGEHHVAEVSALLDTGHFAHRAQDLYGYDNFVCDSGGSICEVIDPDDPADPVMAHLRDQVLMVWIKGSDAHTDNLVARFKRAPKPMCYRPEFLHSTWQAYLADTGHAPDQVDPGDFATHAYARAMQTRQPRYAAMARHGITVEADAVAALRTPQDAVDMIAAALPQT